MPARHRSRSGEADGSTGQNACPVKCEAYLTGVCVRLRLSAAKSFIRDAI